MSTRSRLLLDVTMFAALVIAFYPAWTGLAIHEWVSIAVIVPLLVHLIINWDWTVRIINTFVDRLLHATRLNLLIDVALFVSTVAVMLSGLLISQVLAAALGLMVAMSPVWVAVHSVSANATIALLLVHLALHWRWITVAARRIAPAGTVPTR
jgi:hypothetical protein